MDNRRTPLLVNRKFSQYLLPTVLTSAAVSVASVTDGVIVGNLLGSSALAAVGLTSPFIYGSNAIFALFAVGGVTCASTARGERQEEQANRFFTACLYVGVAVMLLYALAVTVYAGPLCAMLADGNAPLAEDARRYITSQIWAGPFLVFSLCSAQFWKAEGSPKASTRISLIANGVNLVLDYVLIRFINAGIRGAGISTMLGYAVGAVCTMGYYRWNGRNFRFLRLGKWLFPSARAIMGKGAYRFLTSAAFLAQSLAINTLIVQAFGPDGLAVLTICVNALMIAGIFVGGAAEALQPILATLFGEKDIYGIRVVFRRALMVTLGLCAPLAAVFVAFPGAMGALFGSAVNADILYTALRLYAIYIPLYAASQLLQALYNSTGHSKRSVCMSTVEGFVLVIGYVLLLNVWNTRLLWLCYALASATMLLLAVAWAAGTWRCDSTLNGVLLLPEHKKSVPWQTSLLASNENAAELSKDILNFGKENGLDAHLANRIAVASEEITVNTALMNRGKKPATIDVLICVSDEDILLRFRDDGILFNPLTYNEGDELIHDSVNLMMQLAYGASYSHQLGFNIVTLSFPQSKAAHSA